MGITVMLVPDGTEVDRVTLEGGTLQYATGAAQSIFDTKRHLDLDDMAIYDLMKSWSNGYLQTCEIDD